MKKIYLVLFGAMFMTTAFAQYFAQYGKGGLVLDSTYHTFTYTYHNLGETRETKTIYEYNADKKIAAVYYYDYFDSSGRYVNIPLLNQKQEASYNDLGQIIQIKTYFYRDGKYELGVIKEMSDFDAATGIPKLILIKKYEQIEKKTVVTKINNYGIEDETEYKWNWNKETWVEYRVTHYDYNSDGTIAKKTTDYGGGYITVITYEYDENKNVTKESSVTTYEGSVKVDGTYVDVYTNEYYDDGNLKKVTKTTVGEEDEPDVDYYFWGDGKAKGGDLTAINAVRKQMEKIQRIYDLNGRNVKNPTKGLYIVNGRKVVVK